MAEQPANGRNGPQREKSYVKDNGYSSQASMRSEGGSRANKTSVITLNTKVPATKQSTSIQSSSLSKTRPVAQSSTKTLAANPPKKKMLNDASDGIATIRLTIPVKGNVQKSSNTANVVKDSKLSDKDNLLAKTRRYISTTTQKADAKNIVRMNLARNPAFPAVKAGDNTTQQSGPPPGLSRQRSFADVVKNPGEEKNVEEEAIEVRLVIPSTKEQVPKKEANRVEDPETLGSTESASSARTVGVDHDLNEESKSLAQSASQIVEKFSTSSRSAVMQAVYQGVEIRQSESNDSGVYLSETDSIASRSDSSETEREKSAVSDTITFDATASQSSHSSSKSVLVTAEQSITPTAAPAPGQFTRQRSFAEVVRTRTVSESGSIAPASAVVKTQTTTSSQPVSSAPIRSSSVVDMKKQGMRTNSFVGRREVRREVTKPSIKGKQVEKPSATKPSVNEHILSIRIGPQGVTSKTVEIKEKNETTTVNLTESMSPGSDSASSSLPSLTRRRSFAEVTKSSPIARSNQAAESLHDKKETKTNSGSSKKSLVSPKQKIVGVKQKSLIKRSTSFTVVKTSKRPHAVRSKTELSGNSKQKKPVSKFNGVNDNGQGAPPLSKQLPVVTSKKSAALLMKEVTEKRKQMLEQKENKLEQVSKKSEKAAMKGTSLEVSRSMTGLQTEKKISSLKSGARDTQTTASSQPIKRAYSSAQIVIDKKTTSVKSPLPVTNKSRSFLTKRSGAGSGSDSPDWRSKAHDLSAGLSNNPEQKRDINQKGEASEDMTLKNTAGSRAVAGCEDAQNSTLRVIHDWRQRGRSQSYVFRAPFNIVSSNDGPSSIPGKEGTCSTGSDLRISHDWRRRTTSETNQGASDPKGTINSNTLMPTLACESDRTSSNHSEVKTVFNTTDHSQSMSKETCPDTIRKMCQSSGGSDSLTKFIQLRKTPSLTQMRDTVKQSRKERSFVGYTNGNMKQRRSGQSVTNAKVGGKPSIELYKPPSMRTSDSDTVTNDVESHYAQDGAPQRSKSGTNLPDKGAALMRSNTGTNFYKNPMMPYVVPIPILAAPRVHFQPVENVPYRQVPPRMMKSKTALNLYTNQSVIDTSVPPPPLVQPSAPPQTTPTLKRSKSVGSGADIANRREKADTEFPDLGTMSPEALACLKKAFDNPSKASARTIMDAVRHLFSRLVESSKLANVSARLCMAIIEKESGETFFESLMNACQEWYRDRDRLLRSPPGPPGTPTPPSPRWVAFVCFLHELYLTFKRRGTAASAQQDGLNPALVILKLLAECCIVSLRIPAVNSLPELECVFVILTGVGRDLETGLPAKMSTVMSTIRDSFMSPDVTESARKTLLQMVELHSARWQLPATAVMYYYPSVTGLS